MKTENEEFEDIKENQVEPSKTIQNDNTKNNEKKLPENKKRKKQKPPINSKEYVENMIKRKKRNIKIAVITLIVLVILLLASTVLAITTMTSSKIIEGISIDSIDVSGLDKMAACQLLEEKIKERQNAEIKLKYKEYEKDISLADLEIKAEVEEIVEKALKEGRDSNIFINNYNILQRKMNPINLELNITYNSDALENSLIDISTNIPGIVQDHTYSVEEDELIITKGKDGIVLDKEKIKNQIAEEITDISKNITKVREIPVKEEKAKDVDIEAIYKEVYSEPQDAYIVEEPFQVVVDKDGIDFAISMDEAKAILAETKEEYSIPLKVTKAKTRISDLGSRAFPDKLSSFTTRYDAGIVGRTTNLGIATRKINNYVLQPGEVFSYNKALGARTVQNGYKEGAIYENGRVVNGIGGGICQISSTLYNAVLEANLEIVERRNHSFTTSYLEAGKDATVVYGAIDFKFKNNRKYPIKIVAGISGGVASVSIYGLKEEVEYDVKVVATKLETIPCAVEKIEDPTLPVGMEQVVTNGTNGARSVTYKYVYTKSGQLVSKTELSRDTYGTMKRVVRVGTKVETTPIVTTPDPVKPTPPTSPTNTPEPSKTPTPSTSVTPSTTPSTSPTNSPEPTKTPTPSVTPTPTDNPDEKEPI